MKLLIDLSLVIILVWAAWSGYVRGGIDIGLETLNVALSATLAFVVGRFLGEFLDHHTGIWFGMWPIIVFLGVWVIALFGFNLIINHRSVARRRAWSAAWWNQTTGLVLNVARWLIIVMVIVIALINLPLPLQAKNYVVESSGPRFLLNQTTALHDWFDQIIGHVSPQLLNLTPATQIDTERKVLGFTNSQGRPSPEFESSMLVLINEERARHGLAALLPSSEVTLVARKHSQDMLSHGYFSHVNNAGQDPYKRLHLGGVYYWSAGENLAFAPTLNQAHTALMNSPEHKANILSPNYGHVGIGVINAGSDGLMITQDFTN